MAVSLFELPHLVGIIRLTGGEHPAGHYRYCDRIVDRILALPGLKYVFELLGLRYPSYIDYVVSAVCLSTFLHLPLTVFLRLLKNFQLLLCSSRLITGVTVNATLLVEPLLNYRLVL